MIHAEPGRLADLRYVVLDEVHYLQDPYRGGVWEEVILGAPLNVTLVCLSATVANADQLAAWISQVRGTTGVVIESHRPVELKNLFVVGDRSAEHLHLLPTFVEGRPNPEAIRLDDLMARPGSGRRGANGPRRRRGTGIGCGRGSGRGRPQLYRPRRVEVVDRLDAEHLLPAIYFVFSRAGCDESVRHCLDDGLRLTTPDERRRIRAIVESYVDPLTDDDLGGARLPRVRRGPRGRRGGPSRRHGAAVSRGGGGMLRGSAREGRLRHRDARSRHQHARQVGRHRGGDQVRRQGAPRAHAGRVHPAHGTCGQAGHRRDRLRGGPVLAVPHLRRRGPHRRRPPAGTDLLVPAHLQPGRKPRPPPQPRVGLHAL